jgi:oligoribonuclease (3'-5' exoribonuclease)
MTERFRQDNTSGYSDADLAELNRRFDLMMLADQPSLAEMSDLIRKSHEDHLAERVLAAFDAQR